MTTATESLPPPTATTGPIAWVKERLFATPLNAILTILSVWLILMAVFLSLSLAGSAFMNWYNRRVALVQR